MAKTMGSAQAAVILGISPQLVSYRARTGKIRVHRHRPLLFRLSDLIEYRPIAQIKDPRGRRPKDLTKILEEAFT